MKPLLKLENELKLAKGRGAIIFIVYDKRQAKEIKDRLINDLPEITFEDVNLFPESFETKYLPGILYEKKIKGIGENVVFNVFGFEDAVPEIYGFVQIHRETIAEIERPILLWVPEYIFKEIPLKAPDFYRFRSSVYWFIDSSIIARNFRGIASDEEKNKTFKEYPDMIEGLPSGKIHEKGIFKFAVGDKEIEDINKTIKVDEFLLNDADDYTKLSMFSPLADSYRKIGKFEKAIEICENAIKTAEKKKDKNQISKFLFKLGEILQEMGNAKKAIDYYEQALSIDRDVYGERHPAVAAILNNIGGAWHALGEHKKAIEYYEQALSIDKKVYGRRHSDVATTLNNIGMAWHALGKHKKAIDYFEQALSLGKEVYGERHPDVAATLNNIGGAWDALGEPKKAIEYYEQALSLDREVYGERHPAVAIRLNNIGLAWHVLGEPKKAIDYYQQALSINREVYGERHPDVATRLNNIGGAWNDLGEPKKAIDYYQQALSINREVYGERHPDVAGNLNNIGGAWDDLGEHKKAIEYYEQALSIDREIYGERHPAVARDLSNIGGALYVLGDFRNAKKYFRQAYDIFYEFYGDEHPHTKSVKRWLTKIESKNL